MAVSSEYKAFVAEQLEPLGPVTTRNMFGGAGVYLDGLMFGLIANETLYFKVDDRNRVDYESEGLGPFTVPADRVAAPAPSPTTKCPSASMTTPTSLWNGLARRWMRHLPPRRQSRPERNQRERKPRAPEFEARGHALHSSLHRRDVSRAARKLHHRLSVSSP